MLCLHTIPVLYCLTFVVHAENRAVCTSVIQSAFIIWTQITSRFKEMENESRTNNEPAEIETVKIIFARGSDECFFRFFRSGDGGGGEMLFAGVRRRCGEDKHR